ncbi:MAG: ABC transporter permease [Bacteroidota bacterium]
MSQPAPPNLPLRLLRWFCHPDLVEDVEGDLSELFSERAAKNKVLAKIRLFTDVFLLFRPGIIKNFQPYNNTINYAMITNYLKIARRNALRYKGYTLLNLLGLVTGIASALLILLWVNNEVNVDKFHENGDSIYQVFRNMRQSEGEVITVESVPKPAADLMVAEYPEVNKVALLSWSMGRSFGAGDNRATAQGCFANKEFLELFTFPLLVGDKTTALDEINAVILSKTMAIKHFGQAWEEEALGQTLLLEGQYEMKVTGVFEDPGTNSTLDFDWLMPAKQFVSYNDWVDDWGNGSFGVYFTVDSEEKAKVVAKRLRPEIKTHTADASNAGDEELIIHKFQDYYLYSNFDNGVVSGGRVDYIRIMSIVAVFLLVIACINFMNLTTARSDRRSKEVGLRKVMGAQKGSITIQFFVESILFAFVGVVLAVGVTALLLPFFNQLVDRSLFIPFSAPGTWIVLTTITLSVGILSGAYPALLLPAFNIIDSLKNMNHQNKGSAFLRKGLVIFQFAISTVLIIGTAVVYQQLEYALNKDIGLEKENLLSLEIDDRIGERLKTYKNELLQTPGVKAVSATSGNPVAYGRSTSSANWEGKDPAVSYEINVMLSDEDFISTMGMKMKLGRSFSSQINDSTNFIINEVALGLMGFDDPIGKSLSFWGIDGKIIGVVKNFHMRNMHETIAPLIITCIDPSLSSDFMLRIEGDVQNALAGIDVVTKKVLPETEFEYEFVDTVLEASYQGEMTVRTLVTIFAGISIFISCLGLFGLSAFTAEQRAKEVGVRKVQGASVTQIIVLLSKDYARLIVVAFIIAVPIGYYFMQQWLNDFEFRTTLQADIFILAGLASLLIGAITVSFKSYYAAMVNPIKSLRND